MPFPCLFLLLSFSQPPFLYLNLHFTVPSCKAEVAFLETEVLWHLLCPQPCCLTGGIRVNFCSQSCKPALLGESWGKEQGAPLRPNSCSPVPTTAVLWSRLGSTQPSCWQEDSRDHLTLWQCSKIPEITASLAGPHLPSSRGHKRGQRVPLGSWSSLMVAGIVGIYCSIFITEVNCPVWCQGQDQQESTLLCHWQSDVPVTPQGMGNVSVIKHSGNSGA